MMKKQMVPQESLDILTIHSWHLDHQMNLKEKKLPDCEKTDVFLFMIFLLLISVEKRPVNEHKLSSNNANRGQDYFQKNISLTISSTHSQLF